MARVKNVVSGDTRRTSITGKSEEGQRMGEVLSPHQQCGGRSGTTQSGLDNLESYPNRQCWVWAWRPTASSSPKPQKPTLMTFLHNRYHSLAEFDGPDEFLILRSAVARGGGNTTWTVICVASASEAGAALPVNEKGGWNPGWRAVGKGTGRLIGRGGAGRVMGTALSEDPLPAALPGRLPRESNSMCARHATHTLRGATQVGSNHASRLNLKTEIDDGEYEPMRRSELEAFAGSTDSAQRSSILNRGSDARTFTAFG